jgi:hypothetical protein
MTEYLGFVDLIGRTIDGKYLYRFDFTLDADILWGEFFNVTPSAIIPDLQPDINALSHSAKVIFPREMVIAKKNFCFSMQDCIDGILPLIFSEIDENTIEYNNAPFFIRFGETFEEVTKKLNEIGLEMFDITEIEHGDKGAIDDLIDSLDGDSLESEDDDDNDFDDDF